MIKAKDILSKLNQTDWGYEYSGSAGSGVEDAIEYLNKYDFTEFNHSKIDLESKHDINMLDSVVELVADGIAWQVLLEAPHDFSISDSVTFIA